MEKGKEQHCTSGYDIPSIQLDNHKEYDLHNSPQRTNSLGSEITTFSLPFVPTSPNIKLTRFILIDVVS